MGNLRTAFSFEWVDLVGDFADASGTSAPTLENYGDGTHNSGLNLRFFRHDQNDEQGFVFQLNHFVRVPGVARFHIHVIPMSIPVAGVSDIVRWTYWWTIAGTGSGVVIPRNAATWTTATVSQTIATTAQYTHVAFSVVEIPIPEGTPASSMIIVRLQRPGAADAADTYTVNKATTGGTTGAANLAILAADLHVQVSRAGTRQEFV